MVSITTKSCRCCAGSGRELDDVETGAALRALREKAGIRQKTIAHSMGFTPPYISGLEKGDRHWSPSLIQAYKRAIETNK